MRNAVAFANNDVVTIAWSYGAKPEGCMGFALYWLHWYFDAQGEYQNCTVEVLDAGDGVNSRTSRSVA
jgi:hypothetical protein